MENKNEENENKIILRDFVIWIKCPSMMEIKHKDFIDTVPITPSLWIMPWGSMEEIESTFS